MKYGVILLTILMFFSMANANNSQILEIDLNSDINSFMFFPDQYNFHNSDNWVYGLHAEGWPVYRVELIVPTGANPVLTVLQIESSVQLDESIKSELTFFDQPTDAGYDLKLENISGLDFNQHGHIQYSLQKKYSYDGQDYFDLLIVPFTTDPEQDDFTVITEIQIEIETLQNYNMTSADQTIPGSMNTLLSALTSDSKINPTDNITLNQSSRYSQNPDFVVITNAELSESFKPFINWKRALGYNCHIKLIEEIELEYAGVDLAQQIRLYLSEAYSNGLEWVLLGGDETIIPVRKFFPANTNDTVPVIYQHPSDLYYADLTGEWDVDGDNIWGEPYHDNPDLQPELFVGRVSALSAYEVSCWVEKTINYENGTVLAQTGYAEKALISSADQMRDWWYNQGQENLIAEHFPENIEVDLTSMAEFPTGADLTPSLPPAPSFIEKFSEGWNLAVILAHGICDGFVSMSSGYNEWPKTYVWVGSGSSSTKGYLDDLTNQDQAGVVYSVACSQGGFDMDQPPINAENRCVAEAMTNLENRGAAAFIGYSRYGWVASSYKLAESFVDYIYNTDNRIGPANVFSKLEYSNYRDLNYGLNLFGDPSLRLWTETPSSLSATHPDIITLGDNALSTQITSGDQPVMNALVTILNSSDALFSGLTDVNGNLDMAFNTGVDSAITMTVSKPGYKPYQVQISTSISLDADNDTDNRPNLPNQFTLYQNYPNPANPSTVIGFNLPTNSDITLEVYNLLGQKMMEQTESELPSGYNEIELDLSDYTSGVYFYRLQSSDFSEAKKLMLLK